MNYLNLFKNDDKERELSEEENKAINEISIRCYKDFMESLNFVPVPDDFLNALFDIDLSEDKSIEIQLMLQPSLNKVAHLYANWYHLSFNEFVSKAILKALCEGLKDYGI